MRRDSFILLLSSTLNIVVAAFILLAILTAAISTWRHFTQRIYRRVREVTGGWWVLVRLGLAIPITAVLVHYKRFLAETFSWFPNWIGEDLLAFLAITFAIVQFLDAREEEKDMRTIERRMNDVMNKISTRGIGPFPDNLDDIVSLVRNAKTSVRIIVDFPGYGQYSAPELHKEYLAALTEAAHRPKVEFQLVSYDDVLTREESKLELASASTSSMRKGDKEKFEKYLAANNIPSMKAPKTFAELHALLKQQQDKNLADLAASIKNSGGLECRYLSERAPVFLWLVDDREAVFTFKNLEKNELAYSIRTTDGWLVNNLEVYFEHTFGRASTSFVRTPSYKLANLPQPLTDGATITITGQVNEADGAIMVVSIT